MEIITDKNFFKIQIERGGDRLSYAEIPYMMVSSRTIPLRKLFRTDLRQSMISWGNLFR